MMHISEKSVSRSALLPVEDNSTSEVVGSAISSRSATVHIPDERVIGATEGVSITTNITPAVTISGGVSTTTDVIIPSSVSDTMTAVQQLPPPILSVPADVIPTSIPENIMPTAVQTSSTVVPSVQTTRSGREVRIPSRFRALMSEGGLKYNDMTSDQKAIVRKKEIKYRYRQRKRMHRIEVHLDEETLQTNISY